MKKATLFLILFTCTFLVSAQVPRNTVRSITEVHPEGIAKSGYDAMKTGDYDNAIKYLTRAIELSKRVYYYYNRAVCYDAIGKYPEAIEDYTKALSIEAMPESYYGIGIINLKLKKFTEAISWLNKALTLNDALSMNKTLDPERVMPIKKNKAETFASLSSAYQNLGDDENTIKYLEAAILEYSKLIEMNPEDENSLFQRAAFYSVLDQPADAIKDYSQIIDLSKKSGSKSPPSSTYYLRAKEYAITEDYKNAIRDFDTFLKTDPNDPKALFYRASCKQQLKLDGCADYKNALKNGFANSLDYKQLMADNPDYISGLFSGCK